MHPELLKIPNLLFYENQIQSSYKPDPRSIFLKNIPLIFINCDEYEDKISNSYFNQGEVNIVAALLKHFKQVCKFDI
jgi:superfamily I DNA and/or RNA helicase